jgi:hypothetical protein
MTSSSPMVAMTEDRSDGVDHDNLEEEDNHDGAEDDNATTRMHDYGSMDDDHGNDAATSSRAIHSHRSDHGHGRAHDDDPEDIKERQRPHDPSSLHTPPNHNDGCADHPTAKSRSLPRRIEPSTLILSPPLTLPTAGGHLHQYEEEDLVVYQEEEDELCEYDGDGDDRRMDGLDHDSMEGCVGIPPETGQEKEEDMEVPGEEAGDDARGGTPSPNVIDLLRPTPSGGDVSEASVSREQVGSSSSAAPGTAAAAAAATARQSSFTTNLESQHQREKSIRPRSSSPPRASSSSTAGTASSNKRRRLTRSEGAVKTAIGAATPAGGDQNEAVDAIEVKEGDNDVFGSLADEYEVDGDEVDRLDEQTPAETRTDQSGDQREEDRLSTVVASSSSSPAPTWSGKNPSQAGRPRAKEGRVNKKNKKKADSRVTSKDDVTAAQKMADLLRVSFLLGRV